MNGLRIMDWILIVGGAVLLLLGFLSLSGKAPHSLGGANDRRLGLATIFAGVFAISMGLALGWHLWPLLLVGIIALATQSLAAIRLRRSVQDTGD